MRSLSQLIFVVLVSIPFGIATAADAFTDPSLAGSDFRFIGEFQGELTVRQGNTWRNVDVGIQVTSLGNGDFQAIEYLHGLPGAGWDGNQMAIFQGRREGSTVTFEADPANFSTDGSIIAVGDNQFSSVRGTLSRINRASPTLGRRPPNEATILFRDGVAHNLKDARITPDGLLERGTETNDLYSDFTLHLEYLPPYMPDGRSQGRGNSGAYLQRRYEVQILDSFAQPAVFNGAGAIYRTKTPDLNMSLPPLTWQTLDIRFQPPTFEGKEKTANARITVWHNGVKIHDNYEIPNKTGAGKPEGPNPMPILFQDHRDPVQFRNIWIVDHTKHPHVDATPHVADPPTSPHQFHYSTNMSTPAPLNQCVTENCW